MPMNGNLIKEKLAQASKLVAESELDAWLIFVRETANGCDSVLPLILEGSLTWQSAILLTRHGRKIAVVGNYDADPLIHSGNWDEVIPYVQSIREPLCQVIDSIEAESTLTRIGLNYSANDDMADGLTHGMYLLLQDYLRDATVVLISAEELAISLRGRKTHEEIARMKEAIRETDKLFEEIEAFASSPPPPSEGERVRVTERAVYNHVQALMNERGFGYAWDPTGDPIVNSGPDSMIGHGIPSDTITIEEGHIFHVDLGIQKDSYCSDLQRCWYVGSEVPQDVQNAMDAVNRAISAAADALKPGVPGHEVDEAARTSLLDDGYEEYMHATGHQVGRAAHDGGTTLGPKWERYGSSPYREVQEDEVYTLELGVILPSRGYLGLEEMVRVTPTGVQWLSNRQLTMPLLGIPG